MDLKMLEEIENEDGTISLNFEADEETAEMLCNVGLKLLLLCKLLGYTVEEMFEELTERVVGEGE